MLICAFRCVECLYTIISTLCYNYSTRKKNEIHKVLQREQTERQQQKRVNNTHTFLFCYVPIVCIVMSELSLLYRIKMKLVNNRARVRDCIRSTKQWTTKHTIKWTTETKKKKQKQIQKWRDPYVKHTISRCFQWMALLLYSVREKKPHFCALIHAF